MNRVLSIARIHEELYHSGDMARLDLGEYLRNLAARIVQGFPDAARLGWELSLDPVLLEIDRMMPCGLIANEILSNVLKHAFPAGAEGLCTMELRKESGNVILRISDTGVGLPPGVSLRPASSLGLQLVGILARQLHANPSLVTSGGTVFEMHFAE